MKNILKYMFLAFTACLVFTACNDDEDGVTNPGAPTNPEIETAGVYSGTWSRALLGSTDEPTTATGTLTFEAAEVAYLTNVTADCAALSVNYSSVANITPNYAFYNNIGASATNGFGVAFSGDIKNNVATISFTKTVREGHKKYNYNYTFEGSKQ